MLCYILYMKDMGEVLEKELIDNLLNKSEEAFLMAIEIYNKPTINYRLEGFTFFICNAWELLLKAKILNDGNSIYFFDKPDRTISLSNCIKNIFTNDKDPVRKNLEIMLGLRNTATHFIIKEMDSVYLPFMQANVLNYSQKLFTFFNRDITEKINSSFLTLVINSEEMSEEDILSKYGKNIFNKYNKMKIDAQTIIQNNQNEKLAIRIDLNLKIVKNREDVQILFGIANDGEENVRIIKELKDTNLTHCYNQKRVREIVSSNLKRKGINIKISQYDLKIICDKFDLKSNEKYFYKHTLTNSWGCSQHLVDFVTELILKDNNIICELKEEYKQKKI